MNMQREGHVEFQWNETSPPIDAIADEGGREMLEQTCDQSSPLKTAPFRKLERAYRIRLHEIVQNFNWISKLLRVNLNDFFKSN